MNIDEYCSTGSCSLVGVYIKLLFGYEIIAEFVVILVPFDVVDDEVDW